MGFEFGNIETTIKKKNRDAIVENIVLYSRNNNKNKHVLFLLEYPIESIYAKTAIVSWLSKQFIDFDIDIVSASQIKATSDQIKKNGIYRFYRENKSDFTKFIREGQTVVIPFGYALNAITLSPDLSVECFQDHVFNKTYFFSPQINAFVFPIDATPVIFKPVMGGGYVVADFISFAVPLILIV
jgi:hypothetical protein